MSETNPIAALAFLIDSAITKAGSGASLAEKLGWSAPALSQIRSGTRPLPAFRAGQLAEYISKAPEPWIYLALLAQSPSVEEATYWRALFSSHKSKDACLVDSVSQGFDLNDAETAALLGLSESELASVRSGERRLSLMQKVRAIDRAGSVRIRQVAAKALPDRLAAELETKTKSDVKKAARRKIAR